MQWGGGLIHTLHIRRDEENSGATNIVGVALDGESFDMDIFDSLIDQVFLGISDNTGLGLISPIIIPIYLNPSINMGTYSQIDAAITGNIRYLYHNVWDPYREIYLCFDYVLRETSSSGSGAPTYRDGFVLIEYTQGEGFTFISETNWPEYD